MVDDMCFIRSMNTEAINHEPAITLDADGQSDDGPAAPGLVGLVRPGVAEQEPADVRGAGGEAVEHGAGPGDLGKAVVVGLSAGEHAGVRSARGGDPILYINNPPGVPPRSGPDVDGLRALNEMKYQAVGDPETHTRIQQYELAFRMQSSVPETQLH